MKNTNIINIREYAEIKEYALDRLNHGATTVSMLDIKNLFSWIETYHFDKLINDLSIHFNIKVVEKIQNSKFNRIIVKL